MSLCILLSTCDRYQGVADYTRDQISQQWTGHPPLFYCGLSDPQQRAALTLRDDPKDWMSITHSACEDLLKQGYEKCYLVLDDHPPMRKCHAVHLNKTLPQLMEKLGAAYISLLGWGQRRKVNGRILGADKYHLEHTSPGYKWVYSLHPGLWNLQDLKELLEVLIKEFVPEDRTPWKFERDSGTLLTPRNISNRCYRVCGLDMTATTFPKTRHVVREIGLFFLDVRRFLVRIIQGQEARDKLDAKILGEYHFYDGPYPIFWSGLMRKGQMSQDLVDYLKRRKQFELLNIISGVVEKTVNGTQS